MPPHQHHDHRKPWLACLAASCLAPTAHAYEFPDADRWTRTAADGDGLAQGDPTTITWSLAPNNTTVPTGESFMTAPSNLISFLDTLYNYTGNEGNAGEVLPNRPWFFLFQESFNRWQELSGITFMYEEEDDGVSFSALHIRRGILETRGDIRIGATSIDGQSGQNTIAFAFRQPNNYGEMVLDSDNTAIFGNISNAYRAPRNVLMHELGHALGIDHLLSDDASFLLEPFLNNTFDGPQLDDILALHRGYGDRYEKTNNGSGNETAALATPLGVLTTGVTTSRGTDADDTSVARADTDFVSIDDNSDIDVFSFTVDARSTLDLTLSPKGPTYLSGPEDGGPQTDLVTAALSDLTLTLLDTDGTTLLIQVNDQPAGFAESIAGYLLDTPGTYYARITGAADAPQLYQLDVLATAAPAIAGDLDADSDVDDADFALFFAAFSGPGVPTTNLDADLDGDNDTDDADFGLAFAAFTGPKIAANVPEPGALLHLSVGGVVLLRRHRVALTSRAGGVDASQIRSH